MISTRFSVGVHILALLHVAKASLCTSDFIAGSVRTNPAVIRRLIGMLKRAGLVNASSGVAGASLAKSPDEITLLEIYRAVGTVGGTLFDVHRKTNQECPVGANIQIALDDTINTAQQALEQVLASRTLSIIIKNIVTHPS